MRVFFFSRSDLKEEKKNTIFFAISLLYRIHFVRYIGNQQHHRTQMRSANTTITEKKRENYRKIGSLRTFKNIQSLCCAHWLEFVSMLYVHVQLDITIQEREKKTVYNRRKF